MRTPTPRQLELLYRFSRGMTVDQAAADIGISSHTVKVHNDRLFKRLGVHRMTEAVAIAVREGWVR
jgi:DNA-binding NarL/FixJ family response regulator